MGYPFEILLRHVYAVILYPYFHFHLSISHLLIFIFLRADFIQTPKTIPVNRVSKTPNLIPRART